MQVVAWRDRSIPLRIAKGVSWPVLPLAVAEGTAALVVALLSDGMNDLPVGLMSGAAIRHSQETTVVAHATLIGVDLGPNLSVTGSLAAILWLIARRRENVEITAWEFFKIGIIAMPLALIAGLLVLWN